MNRLRLAAGLVVALALAVAAAPAKAGLFTTMPAAGQSSPDGLPLSGLSKIKHLIFIVQENRSFDEFFGTFPGADGLPTSPPCQIDPWYPSKCDKPYLNHAASNDGGPYVNPYQVQDVDGGKMDGFVESREQQLGPNCAPKAGRPPDPNKIVGYIEDEGIREAANCTVDVMGYHDGTDLPNYWSYAQNYVLFDHFYESAESWSLPAHLALFSGWSAKCSQTDPPEISSCKSDLNGTIWNPSTEPVPYLWTDITYLLYKHNISWISYLEEGLGDPIGIGKPGVQGIWAVLGGFETVNDDNQYNNAVGVQTTQFYTDAANGTLPQVSWLLPDYPDSDHPQASIKNGQTYVTGLINAVMNGPDWDSSAIFIVWDDMGGFYDHEPPPFSIDFDGPGLRTPALLISPFAKTAFVDHQILTTDSFLTLIEDVFLKGKRLSQSGRPDPRPDYRDQSKQLGNLKADFDFNKKPGRPLLLSTHPMTMLVDGTRRGPH